MKKISFKNLQIDFENAEQKFRANGKYFLVMTLTSFVLLALACLAMFFIAVDSSEKVLVPNVLEKDLSTALLEMQEKELYPKIQLRYSENPGDEGKILAQNPAGGAIVKAGRRISLTVSRGVVLDSVQDFIGKKYDDVRMELQSLFALSSHPLITLSPPLYKPDNSEAGTILAQEPESGTEIFEPIVLNLVVSRGPQFEKTRVPDLVGKSIEEILRLIQNSKLVFDFTSRTAQEGEKIGTVCAQQSFSQEFVPNYTRVQVDFAFPESLRQNNKFYGIFRANLSEYPYPVAMTLEAIPRDGERYVLTSVLHTGGEFSAPYALSSGTQIILSVVGKEVERQVIER